MKVPHEMPFSFYFSQKGSNKHGIRVKVSFNPDKLNVSDLGSLSFHGDWEYKDKDGKKVSSKKIEDMKSFFRKYKVMFSGVWENEIQEDMVQDYFRGMEDLENVIKSLESYDKFKNVLKDVHTVEEFEKVVRENHIFSMND